jgi:hypothetical protein
MNRDEKGRYNYQKIGFRFPESSSLRTWLDDNLAPTDDDEDVLDDEYFNWCDNPIRKLFDNPVDSSHRSHLETED